MTSLGARVMEIQAEGRDLVSPAVADAVLRRDGGCVAHLLDPKHTCRDRWGYPHSPSISRLLTLDHVKDVLLVGEPIVKRPVGRKHRYRAPSDIGHLVALCWGAHINTGWATSHRPELREYLRHVNG